MCLAAEHINGEAQLRIDRTLKAQVLFREQGGEQGAHAAQIIPPLRRRLRFGEEQHHRANAGCPVFIVPHRKNVSPNADIDARDLKLWRISHSCMAV